VQNGRKHSPNQPLGFVHGDGELTGAGVTSLKFSVSTGSNRSELTISLSTVRIAAIELLPAVCWATRSASLSGGKFCLVVT